MLFDAFIQRKLASLLRPWLAQEPQLETKLGFLRSFLVARNLKFDVDVLNRLIDDDEASRLSFKGVTIDEVIVRVAHWSAPAFTVEFRGVNVTLFLDNHVSKRVEESIDEYLEERKKKVLAQIDPDGSALYDNIEKMMMTASLKTRLKDSLTNLVLMHCCIHLNDARVRVEYPVSDDKFSWLCYSRELSAESSHKELGCLLGGFIGLLFLPLREISFNLEAAELEVGAEKKDHSSRVLSCVNPCIGITMKDLHLINSALSVPEMNFSFSPNQLQVMGAFNNLLIIESKHVRSGRLLWEIARLKIRHFVLSPGCMFYKVVHIAVLWIRLVKEYQYFLALVGYSEHGVKMLNGQNFSRPAEQQWKMISQGIEKELPAEAIASARRVARYRAALKEPHAEEVAISSMSRDLNSFWRIILPLAVTWQAIVNVFEIIVRFLSLRMQSPTLGHPKMTSEVTDPRCCFHLSLRKISAIVSSIDSNSPPVHKKSNLRQNNSYTDIYSFFLLVKEFLLIYEEGIFEQYISFSLGYLEVTSAPVFLGSENEGRSRNIDSAIRGHLKERLDGSETIVWGEPALMFCHSEEGEIGAVPISKQMSGEMKQIWTRMQLRFQGNKSKCDESPWAICDIRTFLVYPALKSPDSGFSRCSLMVGKLHFAVGYSSVLSIATLLEQVQHELYQIDGSMGAMVPLYSSMTFEELNNTSWSRRLKSSARGMKMRFLKLLPDKHVEVRTLIAGPRVQISLGNDELSSSTLDPHGKHDPKGVNLTIDFYNAEFAVWPTAKSGVAPSGEHQRPDDFEIEFFKLHEPVINGNLESGNIKYASKGQISLCYNLRLGGLSAYFEDLAENHLMQVLLLKPVTAKFSSFRDYLYSFGKSVVVSSLYLRGAMNGVTGFFYMDEFSVILQVLQSLLSAASTPASGCSLRRGFNREVVLEHQMLQMEPLNEETFIGTDKMAFLNSGSALLSVSASFELAPFDIILHNSRNGTEKNWCSMIFEAYAIRKLGLAELPNSGIWLSVQKTHIDIFVGEVKAKIDADFSGFHSTMFKYKNQTGSVEKSEVENAVLHSVEYTHEVSLSGCTFNLFLDWLVDSGASSVADSATSSGNSKGLLGDSPSITDSEGLNPKLTQDEGFESNVSESGLSHWLLVNSTIDEIFMGTCSVKNGLLGAQPVDKLYLSLSVGGDFESIILGIQGGRIFIETTVLVRFAYYLTSYLQFIRSLCYIDYRRGKLMKTVEHGVNVFAKEPIEEPSQRKTPIAGPFKWELLEAFSINLSQFSLIFLATDESSSVKEIIIKVDFSLKLGLENMKKKFLFHLSHLEVFSQMLDGGMGQTVKNIQMPHFSSASSSYNSLWLNHENSVGAVQNREMTFVWSEDASCSSSLASIKSSSADCATPPVVQARERGGSYILEQLAISISAEKPFSGENGQHCVTEGWVGNGSVSGLNLTISLSEILMLMATVKCLSEVSGEGAANDMEERSWTSVNQESKEDLEEALPDGAIVAVQDVHQHVYVTVESVENKYRLAGTVHYSLAGKKALFRVKWQKRRIWRFSASWFSLISLYAKTDSGDPLRLNCSASSNFVDISSNNDNACALWRIASCMHDSYEDDDLDPLNHLCKNTFYLVNKKNDCGAAFIHGALEFVKKPGNPFKFKIFHDLPSSQMSESHPLESHGLALLDDQNISDKAGSVPCITLTIEKVSLIIVHELSDHEDKLPLIQGSMSVTELTVQVLPHKTRVISTLVAMLYYFDVYRNLWRELVQPIEICIYWRSTSHSQVAEVSNHGMNSCLYVRMQELDISLTELSLDMLLYVVGKLDLAGPFAVKNSAILANCCKVENQLDLELLCHFYNAQSARVGCRQSAFFSLRNLVDQPLEANYATIRLEIPGMSSTSSVCVPLSETQIFAWRTRIMSLQDSRTYPGPFMVFDISKNAEEGLSLAVYPLLRIHNKTGFPVELRIQRSESVEAESASVLLREGDTVDDCMAAFDAISLSGGPKKALMSLGVGNFVFSFRPTMKENTSFKPCSVEWSDNLKGGKAFHLSGVIDKLSYQVRRAFSAETWKYSFSTTGCSVRSGDAYVAKMHFLVQSIGRDVPIMQFNDHPKRKTSSISLQEQKEIFLLPTVQVSNLLESDVEVLLTETEISSTNGLENINQATIPRGLTVDLYANPAVIFFTITLTMFGSRCKPVNCGHWLKKLNKKKDGIRFLDIDLEFCSGKYFACLRLGRGNRGMLEAFVFTHYTLRNDTDFLLFCATPHLKPLSRDEVERHATATPPHLGSYLPPKSIRSWFMKSNKLCMKLLDEESPESILDLDALSGLAELSFAKPQGSGFKHLVRLGISLGPLMTKIDVPARMVSIVPRYVISNESDDQIFVRQCFVEDELGETVSINSKQKTALFLKVGSRDKRDTTVFDKLLRKHKVLDDDASMFVQFRPNQSVLGWSGPVCVASLGRFFLKFKRSFESPVHQSDLVMREDDSTWEFADVHVVEEASTFVLHFHRLPDIDLPYRIENHLSTASITYYQKDTSEPETLASGGSVNYVWDDLTRPHKLMVKINGINMLREITLDKLRPWKPFFRVRKQRELAIDLPLDSRISDRKGSNLQMNGIDVENVGYEVSVDGPARVLRICHSPSSRKANSNFHALRKVQLKVSYFAIRLFEPCKLDPPKDADPYDLSSYTPIIVGRLENISIDSIIIDQRRYNQIRIQSMNIDEKWVGAPFAAMLRRHLTSSNVTDDCILFAVFVLYPTTSNIQEVKYSSIVLQPIDLNFDEKTLMKIVPFWRTSLSSNTQSQQYYFDHFEIHPVKITTSFLPEDSYSNYSSGQETLRSLLHSIIKIPVIKNLEVELNGVLVTHALATTRELLLRCARHYSWYAMRAIYIAKGSPLLPPTFASVFDDLASSSLDVFFDPSSSLFNVRGLTLGTFKLVSKCIENKGFSGTKRYFGDLSKTLRNAGSNILFAAVTEVSDSVLKGAESSGLNGMVTGFHHGILKLAMEPSLLGTAFLEGGPDRKIKLDRSPGVDELYVEGYLQAMLDTIYKQEYLRVRVIDDQVILKNLPPNSSLIDEIVERVKDFLVGKALLKGDFSASSRPFRHLRGENEWRIGPTVLTLCEHLFVSFAIRTLRKQTDNAIGKLKLKDKWFRNHEEGKPGTSAEEPKGKFVWRWGVGKFVLSAVVAYVDGRLCRCIPNPVVRRIVSGFLLSFLNNNDSK